MEPAPTPAAQTPDPVPASPEPQPQTAQQTAPVRGAYQSPTPAPTASPAPQQQAPAPSYSPPPPQQQQQAAQQQAATQQQQAAAPSAPAAPAIDRGAINEQRRRVIQMAQRIATANAALQSLRESMAQQGLRPRAELTGAAQRMQFEMDQAEAALNNNNPAQGKQHLDYAERALETLEKALNL